MENNNKIYTLFAGVNGAGKTTIYRTMGFDENENRVNADEILVANGGDWSNREDQIKAGREALRRLDSFIKQGVSFNQESILTGQTILRTIEKVKENGFLVNLYYIGLNSPELAIERVKRRVANGGHGIPEDVIRKRYATSLDMLTRVAQLCDFVVVYDNSKAYNKIARYENGSWTLYNEECRWFKLLNNRVINANEGVCMYRTIIELKKDVPTDLLSQLKENIEAAFSNRVGTVKNTGTDPHHFVFAGGEDEFGCLEFGMLCVEDQHDVIPYIESWSWVDEECPDESCNMLEEILISVR
ncbi:hypothetical protein GCWU000282_01185 [Catonella morbi ATCC 51271]|uniref:UDP-N-acetylglucosamine kinase n=1 Tax=Catonella morbi ATCC 51271 TaxID=592026 RepID=V2XMR0_9FIRM|nr:zeta toxin family protein [Catonella morbi]ESL03474.1 hypothetical protein GCWU000282_01185 [Catonella morbi ATCC 51271]